MELASTRSNRNRLRNRFIFIVLFLLIGGLYIFQSQHRSSKIISPVPETPIAKKTGLNILTLFARKKDPDELATKINDLINNTWVNYSIVVDNFTKPFTMNISESEIFTAASVNKIPILAALYYYAQKKDIDLDQVITLQKEDIQDYGTGSLRYETPGTTYSIKTLARLMMKQSDNTAAYILANQIIGIDKIIILNESWGLSQTDMINNKTSNKDMNILLRKMYEEKITNHAYTQEMLSFMKDTDFETRIPANLPKNTIAYHKIGSEVRTLHDVGIVTNGKLTYYIGIFTTDVDDDPTTEALMAKISKLVYDYLND